MNYKFVFNREMCNAIGHLMMDQLEEEVQKSLDKILG